MASRSILFRSAGGEERIADAAAPGYLTDLNLNQIIAAITAGKEEYNLEPYFRLPLRDADDIAFRQAVMQDVEQPRLFEDLKQFATAMRIVNERLVQAETLRYELQKQRWFLDAAAAYCEAVTRLADDLFHDGPRSKGLTGFRDYLARYVESENFTALRDQTTDLAAKLSAIRYSVVIDAVSVEVRRYDRESDYGAEVAAAFERFHQDAVEERSFSFAETAELNRVEAMILERVVKLHPDVFVELENYVARHNGFADADILAFDRELQFFVAYLDHLVPFKSAGLNFCHPRIARGSEDVCNRRGFDLALAGKLLENGELPVCNDFDLKGRERVIVVTGPNQGGKTTFARAFGQMHYLASLGCPVPGTEACLFLFDRLFTHFERETDITNLRGKLHDDLDRVHDILASATSDSIIILNEVFTSATFRDASLLSQRIVERIAKLGSICVWVTFLDGLASSSDRTVSMVSMVAPENPAQRTFKIVRRPADGLAYALAIAERRRLTYDRLRERLGS